MSKLSSKGQSIATSLAVVDQPILELDLVSHVLKGLSAENGASGLFFTAQVDPIGINDLHGLHNQEIGLERSH